MSAHGEASPGRPADAYPSAGHAAASHAPDRDEGLLAVGGAVLANLSLLLTAGTGRGATAIALVVLASLGQALVGWMFANDVHAFVTGTLSEADAVAFVAAVLLYGALFAASLSAANRTVERVMNGLVVRFSAAILAADLQTVGRIGRGRLQNALTRDLGLLIGTLPTVVTALRTLAYLAAMFVMVAVASPALAAIAVALLVLVGRLNRDHHERREHWDAAAALHERQFASDLDEAIRGARELAINERRAEDLYRHLGLVARAASDCRLAAAEAYVGTLRLSRLYWLSLVGIACFAPLPFRDEAAVVTGVVLLVLARRAIFEVNHYLEPLIAARTALHSLAGLEAELREGSAATVEPATLPAPAPFSRLAARNLVYAYPAASGERGFRLGPLDLEIEAGDIVLLSGGNGSGKSTFLSLICGLVVPTEGSVEIDGQAVPLAVLRSHFSAVFADFELFEALHGVADIDEDEVDAWLRRLSLFHKVHLDGRRFSTTRLSSGQRRRLALVAALCERRPVLICDEWTADQSPEFRRLFFTAILPELKRRGMTVIAVSHDDRHFDVADLHVHLADGRIVSRTRRSQARQEVAGE